MKRNLRWVDLALLPFGLCVLFLLRHTTYQMVNLLIFVLFYLILLGMNVLISYYLLTL